MIEIIILETPTILEKLKLSNFSLKINIIKRRKTNGITIGRNSIIGAGSVVTKDVLENSIYAGNPAKLIRRIN